MKTCYKDRGDFYDALKYQQLNLDIEISLGCKEGMASDYASLVLILYKAKGDLGKATEMFKKSIDLFLELGVESKVEQIRQILKNLGG